MKIRSFDVETFNDKKKLTPYLISFVDSEKKKTFFGLDCVEEFVTYLEKTYKNDSNVYIFSHNLTFDGSILIQNLKNKDFNFNGLFFKGEIYFLELKLKEINIKFKCSYKFFPTKLENGNKFLLTNKKLEFNYNKININNFHNFKEEVEKYCINDAVIVTQIIKEINDIVNPWSKDWIKKTNSLPGLSLNIYFNNFNKSNIKKKNLKIRDNLIRQGYFGGRCEVFGNPKNNEFLYHFDFTGMYAQVMLEKFNYGKIEIVENNVAFCENGFFHIEAYSKKDLHIPILPHKNEKLLFANGYISGLFWWEEIKLFIENGGKILKIKYWIKYEKEKEIFKNFTETFSKERKKNIQKNNICKLLINSIYGRMGMSEICTKTILANKFEYAVLNKDIKKKIVKESWVGEFVFVEIETEKEKSDINSNVDLAAMVTSKARIKLYKGFKSIIDNGGKLLYCDTDSIFSAFEKNVDNCKFGEIFLDTSKKDTKIKKALFALPKSYSIIQENGDNITKLKGFNNYDINFNEFEKIFNSNKKKKILIKTLKKSNFIIEHSDTEKIINLKGYDKRLFNKDFKETKAIYIKKTH